MIKYKCFVYYDKNQNHYTVKLPYYNLRSLMGNKNNLLNIITYIWF